MIFWMRTGGSSVLVFFVVVVVVVFVVVLFPRLRLLPQDDALQRLDLRA